MLSKTKSPVSEIIGKYFEYRTDNCRKILMNEMQNYNNCLHIKIQSFKPVA